MLKLLGCLLCTALPLLAVNHLPDGSFEQGGRPAWNRMRDQPYLVNSTWKRDQTTAFHGQYSLCGDGAEALILSVEASPTQGIFSIYVKAEGERRKVTLEAFGYKSFNHILLGKLEATADAQWQRLVLPLEKNNQLRTGTSTPLFFRLTPLTTGKVWVDAGQYEHRKCTDFSDYAPALLPAEQALVELKNLPQLEGCWQFSQTNDSLLVKQEFTVEHSSMATAVPVSVVLPIAENKWHGNGGVQISDANGNHYPAQVKLLAAWPRSGSVRAALVHCELPLQAGSNTFWAEAGPELSGQLLQQTAAGLQCGDLFLPTKTTLWPGAEIQLRDLAGDIFTSALSSEETLKIEENGPLYAVLNKRGILVNKDKQSLARYSCRLHFYRGSTGVRLEVTIENPNQNQILVFQDASLRIQGKTTPTRQEYFQHWSPDTLKYALPYAPVAQVSGAGVLLTPQPTERHPTYLSCETDGTFVAALWPQQAQPLILSQKMTLHREFYYSPQNLAPEIPRHGLKAIALAKPANFASTDFFVIPIGTLDNGNFPYLRERLLGINEHGQYSWQYAIDKHLTGAFNYGDLPGDGGWGNLESFLDFSAILQAVVFNDLPELRIAFDRAIHYREVDISGGFCNTHSPNHTAGSHSTSHSWPQGLLLHYLLTGAPRSREVAAQVAAAFLSITLENKELYGSRSLSRYLLGLCDLYAALGDERLKERFFQQMDYAEKQNLNDQHYDDTIFPWNKRLDPYQVWYGACAFMQMYQLTGAEHLLEAFRREMQASLNPQFFFLDLQECWPGLSPEEAWPIQLGYHSRHRGSLFYPLMKFYSDLEKDPKYLSLAQQACYADYCRGSAKANIMDVFRLAALSSSGVQANEQELLANAKELVLQAAAPTLLNGDFSHSSEWFTYWHLPALRQMGFDEVVKEWPLSNDKDFALLSQQWIKFQHLISPWRYYSRLYGALDQEKFLQSPPSLRVQVSSRWALGRIAAAESVQTRLTPGKWRLRGAYSLDAAMRDSCFGRWQFFHPGESPMWLSFNLRTATGEGVLMNNGRKSSTLIEPKITFQDAGKDDWRTFELTFRTEKVAVGSIFFYLYLDEQKQDGFANIDDISLEKIAD